MENHEKLIHQEEAQLSTSANTTNFSLKLSEVQFSTPPTIGFYHNLYIDVGERRDSSQNLTLSFWGINSENLKDLGDAFLSLAEKLEQRKDKIEEAKEAMKKINI